jgi:hypothetical protein
MARCIAFIFAKFSPTVTLKTVLLPVGVLEQAKNAEFLLEKYDPTVIMRSMTGVLDIDPQQYTRLKEEMLSAKSDGYELVNWHIAMVEDQWLKGAVRWEDTAYYAVIH